MIYNTLTGKRYPTRPAQPTLGSPKEKLSREEAEKALDASLDQYQELMNVDREELIRIIQLSKSFKKA
jgi:CBS-domain-containing membrane protein